MPLSVPCSELQAGMRLAEAVMHGERMLLPGGKTLNAADVHVLQTKYPMLGLRIGDPILDNVCEFEDDSRERQVAETVQRKIGRAMSQVQKKFSSRTALTTVNFAAVRSAVSEVMQYLKANPVSAALLGRSLSADGYLSEHAGNVFYLSTLLGTAVRDYVIKERERRSKSRWLDRKITMDLTPLGLASVFLDVGMIPLQHLFEQSEPLSTTDKEAIHAHPQSGAAMLPEDFSATARLVVRTHHENMDGSGYPQRLRGEDCHIFTRIVRITDAFDAATSSQVFREAKTPARVIWEMTTGPYARFYDPVLMKVFCRLIQPFPIGAKLRLEDGRYAVVVRYNRKNPFLPVVIVAFDENGGRLPSERLEGPLALAEQTRLRLHSFDNDNLSFVYGMDLSEDFVPSHTQFETLFESAFP